MTCLIKVEGIEPTNNRAARALRFAILWRKRMQGTYNAKWDHWVKRTHPLTAGDLQAPHPQSPSW